jgi:general secretion pathway protein D
VKLVCALQRAGALLAAAALLVAPGASTGQQANPPAAQEPRHSAAPPVAPSAASMKAHAEPDPAPRSVRSKDRRRAAKLYLEGTKLFEDSQFERAMHDFETAESLDPSNRNYSLSAQIARSHAVTALIQAAAKARNQGAFGTSRSSLQRARELDPVNPQIAEHVDDLADSALQNETRPLYERSAATVGGIPVLEPSAARQSFHLKLDRRSLIQQVYKAFGIDATLDQTVTAVLARFDADNVSFHQAAEMLGLVTESFSVTLDPHRVLVVHDTRENRLQFLRQEVETLHLPGMTQAELTEVVNLAKTVFGAQQVSWQASLGTVTLRAPASTLDAFNRTVRDLLDERGEVMLDVRIIQLAHTNQRTTGVQLPQQVTAFNVYAEEQAILNANQDLVQQIISSGLAAPGDTLAILGILLASGQVSSSLFSNGIALFGGGLTLSGVSPGPVKVNFDLNSSDSRELDALQLRLEDGQDERILSGSRYPIQTASYSSGLGTSGINIPGLTAAGTSSGLSSLLASVAGANTQIPQVQYQDLGLTLKATPKTMRSGNVALTLDMKLVSLSGSFSNGNPILNNRSYSGVVILKEGEGAVLISEMDKQESLALSGTPALSEIPGMNNLTQKQTQHDYATLLIVLTPHLLRAPHYPSAPDETIRIERNAVAQ